MALVYAALQSPATGSAAPFVELVYFAAEWEGTGAKLTWETSEETDVLGFYVYRSASGDGPQDQLVKAELTPAYSAQGGIYTVHDDLGFEPGTTYWYALVAVDEAGEEEVVEITQLTIPAEPTATSTPVPTATLTPPVTGTPSPSPSPDATAGASPTPPATATATRAPSATRTATPSRTPTATRTPRPTRTASPTRTPSRTPSPANMPAPTGIDSPTATQAAAPPMAAPPTATTAESQGAYPPAAVAGITATPPARPIVSSAAMPAAGTPPANRQLTPQPRPARPTAVPMPATAGRGDGSEPPSIKEAAATPGGESAGGAEAGAEQGARLVHVSAGLGAAAALSLLLGVWRPGRLR